MFGAESGENGFPLGFVESSSICWNLSSTSPTRDARPAKTSLADFARDSTFACFLPASLFGSSFVSHLKSLHDWQLLCRASAGLAARPQWLGPLFTQNYNIPLRLILASPSQLFMSVPTLSFFLDWPLSCGRTIVECSTASSLSRLVSGDYSKVR